MSANQNYAETAIQTVRTAIDNFRAAYEASDITAPEELAGKYIREVYDVPECFVSFRPHLHTWETFSLADFSIREVEDLADQIGAAIIDTADEIAGIFEDAVRYFEE